MARIRGLLIDNTAASGAVYTNVSKPSDATNTPTHNLAVVKKSQFTVVTKAPDALIQVVKDPTGWRASNVTSISAIIPTLRSNTAGMNPCPTGQDLILSFRLRSASTGLDTVLSTINMPASNPVAIASSTALIGNIITCASTSSLSVGMPILFNSPIGNIKSAVLYYVLTIPSSTTFTISSTLGGIIFTNKIALGSTFAMSAIATKSVAVNFTLLQGDILFTDIVQVGSGNAGKGLITYYNYY